MIESEQHIHRLFCRIFSFSSVFVIRERFYSKKRKRDNINHEATCKQYLHSYTADNAICNYYHLPLSTNYYARKRCNNSNNLEQFAYKESRLNQQHFITCEGCMQCFKSKRRDLKILLKKPVSQQDGLPIKHVMPSVSNLLQFMIQANTTCNIGGKEGVWVSTRGHPCYPLYTLTIDIPASIFISELLITNNLLVVLQCVKMIRGNLSMDEFQRWCIHLNITK